MNISFLQVNNNSLVNADHHLAVAVLKDAGNNVTMVVGRETLLPGHDRALLPNGQDKIGDSEVEIRAETIATTLKRDEKGLGFSIAGGRGSTPYKGNDEVGLPR